MPLVSYSPGAAWSGFQSWLMGQGLQYCQQQQSRAQQSPISASLAAGSYAQPGSQIRYSVLTTLSSATVYFHGQFQTERGQWQNVGQVVVGTTSGGIDRITQTAAAGWYSNMVADVGSATVSGSEVYVLVELGRTDNGAFQPYAVLLSGYITTNQPIDSQAGPNLQTGTSGAGAGGGCCLTSLSATTQGGTTTLTYNATVSAGTNVRVLFVASSLTTSAAAANRLVLGSILPSSGYGYESRGIAVQTAGTTRGYVWQAGGARYQNAVDGNEYLEFPENLWLDANFTIRLSIQNVQAGDDWSTADITLETRS